MILGHDHGMGVTFDAGRTWLSPDNKPLAQFYAIGYDMEQPYNVYGGLQDNGSARGPSTMKGGGTIPFEAWYRVGGGDGFYNVVDPTDSRWLYNESQFGAIQRMDQKTGQSRSIRYTRPQGQEALRWNWSSPILLSPHNPEVVYHGANVLLRSSNRGDTWTEISPDLTKNLPDRRNGSGNIQYATITTIDESPVVAGVIWVGTDDGNVQVTRDGGKTWTNVTDKITGPSRSLGQPRDRVASRCGHRVRHRHRLPQRRLQAVRLEDHRLRRDVDVDRRQPAERGDQRDPRGSPESEPPVRRDRLRRLRVARRRQGVAADEERHHHQPGARSRHPSRASRS